MLFLHTSDWHLGASDGEFELQEDQRFFIDEICRIIQERHVDAVLLAGDVFDRAVASASAIRPFDYAMDRFCLEFNRRVIAISGNHDSAERLSSCGNLLEKAGLYICGALEAEPKVIPFDDSEVFLLPWITEEKVKSLYPDEREGMDHMRSHHAKVVKELLDERKVAYLYLPPYSPDLNPIEKLWSKLKPVLRTLKVRAFEMLPSAVAQAFRSISTEDCKGVVSLMRFMR